MLELPGGMTAMGVTDDQFEVLIDRAMANHCHPAHPRIATRGDDRALLEAAL